MASRLLAGIDPGYQVNGRHTWQWHQCWLALTRGIWSTVDTRDSGISVGWHWPGYQVNGGHTWQWHQCWPVNTDRLTCSRPHCRLDITPDTQWNQASVIVGVATDDDHGYGCTEGASLSHLVNQKTLNEPQYTKLIRHDNQYSALSSLHRLRAPHSRPPRLTLLVSLEALAATLPPPPPPELRTVNIPTNRALGRIPGRQCLGARTDWSAIWYAAGPQHEEEETPKSRPTLSKVTSLRYRTYRTAQGSDRHIDHGSHLTKKQQLPNEGGVSRRE